jgi:16S rRNA processing protein RimM
MDAYKAGRVVKTFGYKGQLIFSLDSNRELIPQEPVFLLIGGKPVPFFISSAQERTSKEWIVELEDVTDQAKAQKLCGLEVAFAEYKESPEDDPFADLKGYAVIDKALGHIGIVAHVMQLPMHDLLVIENKGKEILIPIVGEIIQKVNTRRKEIKVIAPPGLIDLNC